MQLVTQSKTLPLGRLVITTNALDHLNSDDVNAAIHRHARGDWGELCADDVRVNQAAVRDGDRVFSVYRDRCENRFYVITEADRNATTVLLPEDY